MCNLLVGNYSCSKVQHVILRHLVLTRHGLLMHEAAGSCTRHNPCTIMICTAGTSIFGATEVRSGLRRTPNIICNTEEGPNVGGMQSKTRLQPVKVRISPCMPTRINP